MKNTSTKPIPEGYSNVIPYLMVKKADDIINFIKKTFGAKEDHISRNKDEAEVLSLDLSLTVNH